MTGWLIEPPGFRFHASREADFCRSFPYSHFQKCWEHAVGRLRGWAHGSAPLPMWVQVIFSAPCCKAICRRVGRRRQTVGAHGSAPSPAVRPAPPPSPYLLSTILKNRDRTAGLHPIVNVSAGRRALPGNQPSSAYGLQVDHWRLLTTATCRKVDPCPIRRGRTAVRLAPPPCCRESFNHSANRRKQCHLTPPSPFLHLLTTEHMYYIIVGKRHG